jgi:hypothetical protein
MADAADAASVEIVVKLTPGQTGVSHDALKACINALGIVLTPIVPASQSESELAGYHVAHVPSNAAARIVEQLRQCEGVEAAYAKPRSEPPK